ncbi:MAG: DUF808 domain-containing protein [Deltaproteobacteria bacterium]|nr:DUF808 domain-containing protein [Deltaproteobacteria bacterium]
MSSSLLALIDDIATILDDVALLTKVAAKKTAGVVGDDLALNAQQVVGVKADRELPVVWAVAKGSAVNKAILVPAAVVISAVAPWLVTPLLVLGGLFLCFEGVEKLAHKLLHGGDDDHAEALHKAVEDPSVDLVALEKDKIKGAVRTDFVLSAEIIAITLGTVAEAEFATRVTVMVGVAILMTVGVYGLVAAIVKLDDAGLYLSTKPGAAQKLGQLILAGAPVLMKALSVAGTVAMFLVGGGILSHGIPFVHHLAESIASGLSASPVVAKLAGAGFDLVTGLVAGTIAVAIVTVIGKLRARGKPS